MLLIAMLLAASGDARCSSIETADLIACADADYRRADASLNAAYRAAMAKARAADGSVPASARAENDGTSYPQALLSSQRTWLAYRDAECAQQVWANAGGRERPIYKFGCLATLSQARTKQLRDDFSQGH
ncbi:lysozyme inhibitor LprI family protein [Sphingomonas sp.]|uniref:lysozyme inhibitor LprI family protein n=1 Tax=Sphingomonas sp. TaxID=28214 RepID=UPI003AFF9844